MTEPSLPELEAERDRLYAQLSAVGDFRRGSVSENCRKCGKPNCACAQPDHPGHGPRFLWTRTARGRGTGRPAAGGGGGGEGAPGRWPGMRVRGDRERIAEVNERICEARPAAGTGPPPPGGRKKGLFEALAQEKAAEIGGWRRKRPGRWAGRCRPGGCRVGDPRRGAEAGLRRAGGTAGRRSRLPRPAGALRERPRGRIHRPTGARSSTPCSARSR